MESSNFKNKTIVADGGNSEGGAGAKYQGAKHPNEKVVATDSAMIPYAAWQKFARPRFYMISFNSTNDLLTWLQIDSSKICQENALTLMMVRPG